jgi:hypothetical protein
VKFSRRTDQALPRAADQPLTAYVGTRDEQEADVGLHELSVELWRERRLLDLLLFKLEEQQMLLQDRRDQWFSHATREVEAVLARIRDTELARAVQADDVAELVGAPASSSLPVLADHAPSPWDALFREHHEALVDLCTSIARAAAANRRVIASVQRETRQSMVGLDVPKQASAPSVEALEIAIGPISVGALLDQIALDLLAEGSLAGMVERSEQVRATSGLVSLQARQADLVGALRATARAVQPSLQAFLSGVAPGSDNGRPGDARRAAQMWRSAGPL